MPNSQGGGKAAFRGLDYQKKIIAYISLGMLSKEPPKCSFQVTIIIKINIKLLFLYFYNLDKQNICNIVYYNFKLVCFHGVFYNY
jgi:hypothetical protein